MKGDIFIKLRITGQDIDSEEITHSLVQPDFSYHKGDSYTPKYGDKLTITYNEDCFMYERQMLEGETLDQALAAFLSRFEGSAGYIKELSDRYNVTLWISVYPDDEQSSIHLSSDIVSRLADMGVTVDIDMLFLKDFYSGTYSE